MELPDLHLLIVEDEFIAAEYLKEILLALGALHIDIAASAASALQIAHNRAPDIVFMDINISGPLDGIACAKALHECCPAQLIYTTAYKDRATIEAAGETAMQSYLIKPFGEGEVFAALNIVCKILARAEALPSPQRLHLGAYMYDPQSQTVYHNDASIALSPKEQAILAVLTANINCNVSYDTLMQKAWAQSDVSPSTLRDTVSRLRKKLPDLPLNNLPGQGYILKK